MLILRYHDYSFAGNELETGGFIVKIDRLLGIIITLLQNGKTSAPVLAEKFEVSRRTINRDIDALCLAGIPIVTQQGSNGGIYIAEGYRLDKSVLTTDELSGMIAALKGLGTVTEKTQIERTLDKLHFNKDTVVSLRESIIIDLASNFKGTLTDKIELIKQAIHDKHLIEFDYCYEKGEDHRCIEPYFIIFQWTAWYVFGFCLKRHDWRLFKLTRLWNLKQGETEFNLRDIPPEKQDFNARFTDDIKLVALIDPSVKYQVIENYGLDSFTEMPDGLLRLEVGYTNIDYTMNWLLGLGDKVKVLEPLEIRERIIQTAKNIAAAYEGT
jgi:predicted DNA-binding transcriptional regulator YafY